MENVIYKLYELIYPPKTPFPKEGQDLRLGGVRLRDIPDQIDEFYRLLYAKYQKNYRLLNWIGIRPEHLFTKKRFVSFTEYQEISKKPTGDFNTLKERYPIYRLANISNYIQYERFVNVYTNDTKGYFLFMAEKNPTMFSLFNEWHKLLLPESERGKHCYIVGKTGCGKSELMKSMIIQDALRGDSAVVLVEPSGDLSQEIAKQESLNKDRLIYIDCSLDPCTPTFNPFEMLNKQNSLLTKQVQTQTIRNALEQIFNSMDNPQPLTQQMQTITQACLDIIIEKSGSFYDLQRFVVGLKNEDLIEYGLNNPEYSEFFKYKYDKKDFAVSKSSIDTKLTNLLSFSSFADFFCGQSTIDLEQAIEDKKIIIFNLSKGNLGTYASLYIGKIIVAILQNIVFKRSKIDTSLRTPIKLYIDEFQNYINRSVKVILSEGRKYNMDLVLATQTVKSEAIKEDLVDSVLSNTNIKFVGQNNYNNLTIMSREINVEVEVLEKLNVGSFVGKIGTGNGFIFQGTGMYLGNSTCIDNMEWEERLKEQFKKYYRDRVRRDTRELPPPAPPEKTGGEQRQNPIKQKSKQDNGRQENKQKSKQRPERSDDVFTPPYED